MLCYIVLYFFAGTDDEVQDYDYLGAWGPRFDKLADMYGPTEETEHEEEWISAPPLPVECLTLFPCKSSWISDETVCG